MGHGVADGEVYVRHLEAWLNGKRVPGGRRVEVVNLAVSGFSPSQRLWQLREQVGAFEPDWVLCDASVLDASLEELHLEAVVRKRISVPFDYVSEALRRSGLEPGDAPADLRRKISFQYRELTDGAFAGWSAESRRLGVPLTVVILPRADKVTNPRLLAFMKSAAARHRVDVIDLFGSCDGLSLDQLRAAPWDNHPSALGHRSIFEALRDELERRGGPPGLPFSAETARAGAG
jgi:hypothetical protein